MSILHPLQVPSTDADRAAYQLTLERVFLWSLPPFLMLAGVAFLRFPNVALYARFSHDLGILITPLFFFFLCAFGAALAPGIYLFRDRIGVVWKRQLSVLCLSSLILYTVAVGVYSLLTGEGGFGVLVYLLFVLPWVREVFAIYRA